MLFKLVTAFDLIRFL